MLVLAVRFLPQRRGHPPRQAWWSQQLPLVSFEHHNSQWKKGKLHGGESLNHRVSPPWSSLIMVMLSFHGDDAWNPWRRWWCLLLPRFQASLSLSLACCSWWWGKKELLCVSTDLVPWFPELWKIHLWFPSLGLKKKKNHHHHHYHRRCNFLSWVWRRRFSSRRSWSAFASTSSRLLRLIKKPSSFSLTDAISAAAVLVYQV